MNLDRRRCRLAVLRVAVCFVCSANADDLSPRAYVITPYGSNAVVLAYVRQSGGIEFDGSVPITGASSVIDLPIVSYYHGFGFFGRAANVSLSVPYGFGDFNGTVADVPKNSRRSGFLDSSVRLSVNLLGGPALAPADFAKWQQKTLLGFSLKVVAPTGQYDPTRIINWGANRWAFKPEIGYSRRWNNWVADAYAGGWFYSSNPDYFSHNIYFPGQQSQSEAPVGVLEGHISYDFLPRLWFSLDANYWWGGSTSRNGVPNALTNQRNSRIGITGSSPLTRHQSIKFSYSVGAYTLYGGNYRSISVAWQYSWIGRRVW